MSRITGGMGTRMFAVMMAVGLSACTTGTITGRGWIPNAPGDVPAEKEEVARRPPPPPARTAAAPAAPVAEPATSPFRAPPAGAAAPRAAPAASAPAPASAASPASAAGGYTQATRYGDLLFLSGQIAVDSRNQMVGEKVEDQTRQVMENIRQVLEANRLTMANVVSVTVYMKDLAQFRAMDDVYDGYFKGALPARSVVEVNRLPRGALVEISVVAGR